MPDTPIPVLLVDDSPLALSVLRGALTSSSEIQVVGTASNGQEALKLIPQLRPAVVCTDLHMPLMDGLELTARILEECPCPILVVSNAVDKSKGSRNVFELLQAGALDVFPKPRGGGPDAYRQVAGELIRKIRVLSGVKVFRKTPRRSVAAQLAAATPGSSFSDPGSPFSNPGRTVRKKIVVLGASTGGPQALRTILSQLSDDFPLPILCVQHIGEEFLSGLVSWLDSYCHLQVKVAEVGELPAAGTVYFAGGGGHLEVDVRGRLTTTRMPPVDGHRPSVTVTMRSACQRYGERVVGVLLTGMGRDGADGLKAIADVGGTTLAQDQDSCVVFGMPQRAIEMNAAQRILPVAEIAEELVRLTRAAKTV